jgi:UTP--glucose-1-phosphate uridylyltransferase
MLVIRQAVIPVAGWGTRVLPATKSLPKPLLPVADLPTIYYVVEEAVQSGVEHIVFVTSRHMRAVEDFFDENPELTRTLEAKHNDAMLERLRRIETMAQFSFVRQPQPRGLGHAVLMARDAVGHDAFAVLLGDDLMWSPDGVPCLRRLIDVHEQRHASVIATMPVPDADVSRYGIVAGERIGPHLMQERDMVEKPPLEEAPSNQAVVGRYVLTPEIFDILRHTKPGRGGEIQITDALCALLAKQPIFAYEFTGQRYDTGDTVGWLTTSIAYTLRRPEFAPGLKAYLRTLDLSG